MLSVGNRTASRRGQWRDGISLPAPGGPGDVTRAIYRLRVFDPDDCCGLPDYGWIDRSGTSGRAALDASVGDGTNRFVAVATDEAVILTWQFPVTEMLRLRPGSYAVSLSATVGDETSEIASFTVVIR